MVMGSKVNIFSEINQSDKYMVFVDANKTKSS